MTRVLLVRHAESEWNADGRWQGQADPTLSALGARQAAAAVLPAGVSAVWASDLARARATAELLAAGAGLDVRADARLRERDAGEWTGLTHAEIEDAWPGYLAARRRPPGFEPDASVEARGRAALAALASPSTPVVAAVTHSGVIRTLERALGAPVPRLANLEGRWFEVVDGALGLGERVLLLDPDRVEVTVPGQI